MTASLDPRLTSLTPQRLADVVAAAGGAVLDTWDYTYTPAEGGDGVLGHHVLYLADADGYPVGNVGFARSAGPEGSDGGLVYTLADFFDDRYPADGRTSWAIEDNRAGFLRLLAVFLPTG